MAGRRRHHYVPRFYLDKFVDRSTIPPRLWIYDKVRGAIEPSTPSDAGAEKHYYAFKKDDGSRDSAAFEEALSKADNEAAPVLAKLLESHQLTPAERECFSRFLALTMVRGPVYRGNFERMNAAIVKRLTQRRARAGAFDDILKRGAAAGEKLRQILDAGDFEVDVLPQISLPIIGQALGRFAPVFERMSWVLITAPAGHRYVTSDNPLTYMDPTHDPRSPYGVGLMTAAVQVAMPLSTDVALITGWDDEHEGSLGVLPGEGAWVEDINVRTVVRAERFVWAAERSDALLRLVMSHRDSAPRIGLDPVED